VLAVMNPIMRALLGTPLGRAIPGMGVLRFHGRRTGRAYAIVVGLHQADGKTFVLTPAKWRMNFSGGAPAELRHRGKTVRQIGTLIKDPATVASAVQQLIDQGTRDRMIGMRVPRGHRVTPEDVVATGRAMVELSPPRD